MTSSTTIRFTAKLLPGAILALPKTASAKLPSRGAPIVEGTINGFPFRRPLEPNGEGSHALKVNKAMQAAAGADVGEAVAVEITRIGDESEIRMPAELRKTLAAAPVASEMWSMITPMTRRDWILWITSAKLPETRLIRIEKARSMLASGKRRVCCFGGLNWLMKDHGTSGGVWLPLPKSK
jgi:hypothetical protein